MKHKSILFEHKDSAVNMTCNGKCSNCGGCCNPWNPITQEEANKIRRYIKKHKIKYIPMEPDEHHNIWFDCCFHDRKNKKCLIYPVRPEVCRKFICSNSLAKIDKNKIYYDERADINGKHLDRFFPFDLLFYDDPRTLFYFIQDTHHPENEKELCYILNKFGHPDIVAAIKTGNIECTFKEEK